MNTSLRFVVCSVATVCASLATFAEGEITFQGTKNADGAKYQQWRSVANGSKASAFKGDSGTGKASVYGYNTLLTPDVWDGEEISAEKSYLISGCNVALCAPSGETTFPGKLTVGIYSKTDNHYPNGAWSWGYSELGWLEFGGGTVTFAQPVTWANGGICHTESMTSTVNGDFSVTAPTSNPFQLFNRYATPTVTFKGSLAGAAGTAINTYALGEANHIATYKFQWGMSQYFGSLSLGSKTSAVFGGDATDYPGALALSSSANLSFSKKNADYTLALGSLSIAATTAPQIKELGIGYSGSDYYNRGLKVTDALTIADGLRPTVSYAGTIPVATVYYECRISNPTARRCTLLDVPDTGVSLFDLFDFSMTAVNGVYTRCLCFPPVETVAEGRRKVTVEVPKATYMTAAGMTRCNNNRKAFEAGNGDVWNGQVADDGFDADTVYGLATCGNYQLPNADYVFPGKALGNFWASSLKQYADFTADYMMGANCLHIFNGERPATLSGHLFVSRYPQDSKPATTEDDGWYWHPQYFWVADSSLCTIASDIIGDSIVDLRNDYWSNTKVNVNMVLAGDNTKFAGKFRIHNGQAANGNTTTVRASAAKNLGGKLVQFRYNAVGVTDGGHLLATDSFEISEPTRGVYVKNGALGVAADKQLTLGTQLTLGSGLVKEGAGTLALKGVHKFTADQLDTAANGEDVVTVSEGFVKGVSKDATDGLAYTFAAGTGIRLSRPDTASEDEKHYGFYNKNGSFGLTATGGKLRVTVDPVAKTEYPDGFSLKVCTVAEGAFAADDLAIKAPKGFRVASVTSATANGETTFTANFEHSGLVIVFR